MRICIAASLDDYLQLNLVRDFVPCYILHLLDNHEARNIQNTLWTEGQLMHCMPAMRFRLGKLGRMNLQQ